MTLPEFQLLSPVQQLDTLWNNGYVVSERKDSKFLHVFYHIFDFCVELKYAGKLLKAIEASVFTVSNITALSCI